MSIKIPKKTIPIQVNQGNVFGDIWASWNLDLLSNIGKIRVSPQSLWKYTIPIDASIAITPFAFTRTSAGGADKWWALCGRFLYNRGFGWGGAGWAVDDIGGTPTCSATGSDITPFDEALIVSLNESIYQLASGTWTSAWNTISLTSGGIPHPLKVSFNNKLLIGNGNEIVSVLTDNTVDTKAMNLPKEFRIEWIKSSKSAIWVGARNLNGGEAEVFLWDGYSENYNQSFKVGSEYVFSCVIKDEVPYIVNGYGQLMAFTGGGFSEIARFPIALNKKYSLYTSSSVYQPIHRNGMAIIDNQIHILLKASLIGQTSTFLENQLSGVWAYTTETGLHHRFSLTKDTGANIADFGSPVIHTIGALWQIPKYNGATPGGSFLAGATFFKEEADSTLIAGILSLDTDDDSINKLGYLITPEIHTSDIDEKWQKIYLLFKKLQNATDKIVIKYRQVRKYDDIVSSLISTGNWITNTTATVSLGSVELSEGNEIEILSGEGSGLSAEITTITGTSVKTLTMDTAVVDASGQFSFRNEAWITLGKINDQVRENKDFTLGINSSWIQFKIILYGKGNSPELEKLILSSIPQIKSA